MSEPSVIHPEGMAVGLGSYITHKCRCSLCRAFSSAYDKTRNENNRLKTLAGNLPSKVKHTYSTYLSWGCRCDICTDSYKAHLLDCSERRRVRTKKLRAQQE